VFSLQRILLEAITNALRHSGARRLRFVARGRSGSRIEIRVEDHGCGFDPAQPVPGLGLANMRARAEKIGASIDIDSAPGRGTVVALVLPGALPRRAVEDAPAKSEPQNLAKLADAPGAA
jgi:signal transduction histidine kinase